MFCFPALARVYIRLGLDRWSCVRHLGKCGGDYPSRPIMPSDSTVAPPNFAEDALPIWSFPPAGHILTSTRQPTAGTSTISCPDFQSHGLSAPCFTAPLKTLNCISLAWDKKWPRNLDARKACACHIGIAVSIRGKWYTRWAGSLSWLLSSGTERKAMAIMSRSTLP